MVFSEIDLSILSSADREQNFIKRGGTQIPNSLQREAQEHRESTTLMVFYTSPSDIPMSPKEPPPVDPSESAGEEVPFGEPAEEIKVCVGTLLSFNLFSVVAPLI